MTPEDIKGIAQWLSYAARQAKADNGLDTGRVFSIRDAARGVRTPWSAYKVVWRFAERFRWSARGLRAPVIIADLMVCAGLTRQRASQFETHRVDEVCVWWAAECIPRRKVPPALRRFILERSAVGLADAESLGVAEGRAALRDYDRAHQELTAVPDIWWRP